jgi:hypothetical protein
MTKNVSYVALLADIIGSRSLPPRDRARLQDDLREALHAVNRRWRPKIAAGFAIARGDEIQGLLKDASPVWDIVHWLRQAFPTVNWIMACGLGPITTALAHTAVEVDGPCFHAASAALEDAKRHRQVFVFRGFPAALDGLAAYYSALYWSWTPRQRRQASLLRFYGPARDNLEERLKVHPTAVSHMKRRMAWPLVAEGDRMLRAALGATGEVR